MNRFFPVRFNPTFLYPERGVQRTIRIDIEADDGMPDDDTRQNQMLRVFEVIGECLDTDEARAALKEVGCSITIDLGEEVPSPRSPDLGEGVPIL